MSSAIAAFLLPLSQPWPLTLQVDQSSAQPESCFITEVRAGCLVVGGNLPQTSHARKAWAAEALGLLTKSQSSNDSVVPADHCEHGVYRTAGLRLGGLLIRRDCSHFGHVAQPQVIILHRSWLFVSRI